MTARRRILVVATEIVEGLALRNADVFVVAPALNSRLRHWLSDEDDARRAAERRLARSIDGLAAVGVHANGRVGDPEPLQAIEDALQLFPADEIVIATQPEPRSHWLVRNVVERARSRFPLPIVHVVVDEAPRRDYVRDAA